jgi:hypothetical protein
MNRLGALVALVVLTAACSKHKPPAPPPTPPPPPAAEAKAEVAPPPPPKCEALEEKCAATADTKATIAKTDLVFQPPSGWTYAQTAGATLAQAGDVAAVTTVVGYDAGDPKDKKADANRDAAFEALQKLVNVGLKKKVNWKKKPDDKRAPGGLQVSLWQVDGATRGDKKGPLLIFSAPLDANNVLLGFGFVPDDDNSGSDAAIMKSIDSLAKAAK